jgi:hypothetical protein
LGIITAHHKLLEINKKLLKRKRLSKVEERPAEEIYYVPPG